MKKLVLVCAALFLAIPLLFSTDGTATEKTREEVKIAVQDLISSKVLLQKDGIQQLQTVSVNLSAESKEDLYYANRKIGAFAWLNLVVPSVGSWIVGDKEGAIAAIVGDSLGIVVFAVGYGIILSAGLSSYSPNAYSYYTSDTSIASSMGTTFIVGFVFVVVGALTIVASDLLSVMGTYNFVNKYNSDLQKGLGIDKLSFENTNPAYEKMKAQFAFETAPRVNNLVYFELANVRF